MLRLTEYLVQRAIMNPLYRRGLTLPNFTPRRWWECDVLHITAAGYFTEYEIKLNLTDFKADRRKSHTRWRYSPEGPKPRLRRQTIERKHELLQQGNPRGPSRFFYVTPPGLLFLHPEPKCNPQAILPPWAGLLEATPVHGWLRLVQRRPAPRLHMQKVGPKVVEHLRSTCYWRMHELLKTWELIRIK